MQICVQFHFKSEIGTIKKNRKEETTSMLFIYINKWKRQQIFDSLGIIYTYR